MTKNPFLNALTASGYIILVVLIMNYGSKHGPQNSLLIPMAVVSLFTLSAAVMAFVFMYQPFKFYFSDQKEQALNLFLKTVGTFAVITAVIFLFVSFGVSR